MDDAAVSEKFTEMGMEIIETHELLEELRESKVKVLFLEDGSPKKKSGLTVFGDCSKVSRRMKFLTDADFIIRIYVKNCGDALFDEAKYKILLLHELMHVGVRKNKKSGGFTFFLRPHDIGEFTYIQQGYGSRWQSPEAKLDF